VWFGVVLVLVLLAGIRIRASWLPRASIAAGVLALIGLAVANPDLQIARNQVNRPADRIDAGYLSDLSPDAVPALAELPDPERTCVLYRIKLNMDEDVWYTWNQGRSTARDLIGKLRPIGRDECTSVLWGP
jgi:hypothetical protein